MKMIIPHSVMVGTLTACAPWPNEKVACAVLLAARLLNVQVAIVVLPPVEPPFATQSFHATVQPAAAVAVRITVVPLSMALVIAVLFAG